MPEMNNNYKSNNFDSLAYYGIIIYLISFVFEGPIRYILYNYNLMYIIYLRDIFVFIVIAGYISKSLLIFKINKIFAVVIIIFIFHSIIALFYVDNYLMPLFAWKSYLLLFFGILYGHLFFTRLRTSVKIFSFLLICTVMGIGINYFIEFPWEGLEYTLGGVDIEAIRAWSTLGFKRLSGFARTSYDASAQILLMALFLICHVNNNFAKRLIWLSIALPLLLTTTKGIIIIYVLLTVYFLLYRIIPDYFKIYQKALYLLLAIMIIMPILSIYGSIIYQDVPLALESFFMRISGYWPDAFKLIKQDGNLLLGRGLGGMGTSQLYFEIQKYNSADNIFLLFYGNLGLLGIGYLFYLAIIAQSLDLKTELFYYVFIFSFFAYGIVTSCIDNGMFCLFLGVFLGYVHNPKLRGQNPKLVMT